MKDFAWDTDNANFTSSVFAGANDFLFNFAVCLCDSILDARWVDTTILHEALERVTCNLTANWIEATEHDHAWSIVDKNVNAGCVLESLNVAAFLTDNAALHIVIRKL